MRGVRPGHLVLLALGVIGAACDAGYTTVPGVPDTDASPGETTDAGGTVTQDAAITPPKDAGTTAVDASFDAGPPCPPDQDFSMDPQNCGACRHICNVASDCVAGECKRVVFVAVPNNGGSGNLGGLAGADAICQTAAAQGKLHNVFRAWVGVANGGPVDRFVKSSRPYVLPDGITQIATSFALLVATNGLAHPINQDAKGTLTTVARAWTNVNGNGTAVTNQNSGCLGWTSTSAADRATWGNTGGNGNGWSTNGEDSCQAGAAHGLYCFEQ